MVQRRTVRSLAQLRGPGLALVLAATGLTGCSGGGGGVGTNGLSALFSSTKPDASSASAAVTPVSIECPSVDVRQGASTYQISGKPTDDSAVNMRYQVGIGQTARECKVLDKTVSMRIGVQGRVVLGPVGGAGQVEVPLRFAVVREGPDPKTITTKLQRVNVLIPESDANVAFTTVEEDLSFPLPAGSEIDAYVVYVGFDPSAVSREPRRPERRPASPRRTPG